MASNEESILKLFGSEAVQRAIGNAVEAFGPAALDRTVTSGRFNHLQLDAHNDELVRPLPPQLRRDDRRRHLGDPTQHRRRAGPGPASMTHPNIDRGEADG